MLAVYYSVKTNFDESSLLGSYAKSLMIADISVVCYVSIFKEKQYKRSDNCEIIQTRVIHTQ